MKSEVIWELEEALLQFKKQIDAFHAEDVTRASSEQVGENVMALRIGSFTRILNEGP